MLTDRTEFSTSPRAESVVRIARSAIVALARQRLRWPYRRHDHSPGEEEYTHRVPQNDPERGVDCSGFLLGLMHDLGYHPRQDTRHVEEMLSILGPRARAVVPITNGDFVFVVSRGGNGQRYHCGLFDGNAGTVIHASFEHQRVIAEPFGAFLQARELLDRVPYKVGRLPDILELLAEKR